MQLLFVCTGNTCRSPLAEAITRARAGVRGLADLRVASAGTSVLPGASASDGSLLVGLEHGLDLAGHRAQPLTPELVGDADLILVMGPHHRERVEALGGRGRTFLVTEYASGGGSAMPVSDPFGGDLEVYRATWDELSAAVDAILERLLGERPSAS